MTSETRWLIVAALAAGLLILVVGCGNSSVEKEKDKSKPDAAALTSEQRKKRQYPVRVETISTRPLQYSLQAVGTVEAQDVFSIDARVPGTVYDVKFNEGDEVKQDQVLCTVAPEAYRQNALKAKAQLDRTKAQIEKVKVEFVDQKRKNQYAILKANVKKSESSVELSRRELIRVAGAISEEEIQLFKSRVDLAQLEIEDLTAATATEIAVFERELKVLEADIAEKDALWKIAEEDVRKSIVKPPIDGVIEKRVVTNMVFVTAGMQIATMIDRRTLKLHFKLSEKDSGVVNEGTKVTFTVPAFPTREFEATVYHISNQLEAEQRQVGCWARVTRDTEKLIPGYFASVKIVTQNKDRAVVVPIMAVQPTERGFVAHVIKDGLAQRRPVKVGLTVSNDFVEVLEGLSEGESLVIEGGNALYEGAGVRIVGAGSSDTKSLRSENSPSKSKLQSKDTAGN